MRAINKAISLNSCFHMLLDGRKIQKLWNEGQETQGKQFKTNLQSEFKEMEKLARETQKKVCLLWKILYTINTKRTIYKKQKVLFKRMLEEICKRQFFKEMERFKELCLLQERISNIENRKMSNMWEQRELRDTSQRQKQTEQRLKQFNGFMPILSQSCNSRVY